jgi:TPR repeat protein
MRSPMLLSSLEQAAGRANLQGHFLLAALYRCGRPNPYLYEESLKGRVLTAIERGWVDDYLRLEPQYRKYESHLKAAALRGVRAAALEYGTAFESPEFVAMADRMAGDVDAMEMARHAPSDEARKRWLRTAAEQGSRAALEALASQGDAWAEDQVAEWADPDWLQSAAERALDAGDVPRAWTWHYLALQHGVDLTRSTMAAYHDGGERDGQFYDSDFGGPLYAAGYEGLVLPDLDPSSHELVRAKAEAIFSRAG